MRSAMILTICLALFGVPACWGAEQGTTVDTTVEKKVKIKPTQKAKTSKKTKLAQKADNTLKTMESLPAPSAHQGEKLMRIPSRGEPLPDGMRIPPQGEPSPDGMRIPTEGEPSPYGMRVPTEGEPSPDGMRVPNKEKD